MRPLGAGGGEADDIVLAQRVVPHKIGCLGPREVEIFIVSIQARNMGLRKCS